jgi:hypothetical protein
MAIMVDEIAHPIVNRFNPWGQWSPFSFATMEDHVSFTRECNEAAADLDVKAALAYARAHSMRVLNLSSCPSTGIVRKHGCTAEGSLLFD